MEKEVPILGICPCLYVPLRIFPRLFFSRMLVLSMMYSSDLIEQRYFLNTGLFCLHFFFYLYFIKYSQFTIKIGTSPLCELVFVFASGACTFV